MNRYRNILTGEAASAFKKLIGRFYWADDNIVVKHLIEVHERFCGRDCPLEKSNINLQETETEKPAVCPQGSETEKADISPQDSETIERDESTEYHASSEDREKSICLHMEVEDGAESLDEESSGESESEMESEEEVNIKEEQDDFLEIPSKAGSPEMLLKGSSTAGKEDCSPLNPHSNVKPKSTKGFSSTIQMPAHSQSKDATDLKGHVTSQSDMSRKSTDLNTSVTGFNCLNSVKTIVGDTSSAVEVPQPMNNSVSGQTGLTALNAIQSYNTLAESRKSKNQFGIGEIKSPLGQQQFFPVKSEPADFSVSQTQGPVYSSVNLNTSLPLNLPPSADQTTRIQALGGFQSKLSTTCNVFPQSLHTNYYQSVPQSPISVLPSFQAQQPPLNLALMINPVTGSPMLVYSQNLSNPSHSVNELNLATNPVSGVSVLAPNLENQSTSNQVTSSRSTTMQSSSSQSTTNQTTTIQSLTSQSTTTQSTSCQSTTNEATTRQSIKTQSTSSQRKEQVLSSQEVLSTSTTLSPLETKAPNSDASAVQMENSDEQIVDPPCERDLGAPSQSETNKQTSSSMTAKRQISPPTTDDNISQNPFSDGDQAQVLKNKHFADNNINDIDLFVNTDENKNTFKKTKSDVNIFKIYLRTMGEYRVPELIPPLELNWHIASFLLSVRKKDGTEYEPASLRAYISSIDRYLKKQGYGYSVMFDVQFGKARAVLKAKQKQLKSLGKGKKPFAAGDFTDDDFKLFYEKKILGPYTPTSLINSLFLICTYLFGMRASGREIHTLTWGDIQLKYDEEENREYIVYNQERPSQTGAILQEIKPRAYALPDYPEKDPVFLYKKYREKRPQETKYENSPFFLAINPSAELGNLTVPWYRKSPMGINRLNGLVQQMQTSAGIESDKRFTNLSMRKHLLQRLLDSDVPAKVQKFRDTDL